MSWTVFGGAQSPFVWTLLKVCITSKRNDSSTPRNELGRDKGCWGARPSHKLQCFYMAASHQDETVLQHREQNRDVFKGARPSYKFEGCWKVSYNPDEKLSSTKRNELDRVWGSTTIRSFERCWKSAQHQNEMIFQRREMNWAVTKDVGERGPAINVKAFSWLHNKKTKKIFNTVKGTGPCLR